MGCSIEVDIMGWTVSPKAFIGVMTDDLSKLHRATAIEILNKVIQRSPVDTGRFRGNHILTLVTPNTGTKEVDDKSGSVTLAAGLSVVGGIAKGEYPLIYIQNNLPYAQVLEDGSSQQAPLGIYALAVQDVKNNLRAGR